MVPMPTLPSPLITVTGVELLFNPVPVTNSNLPFVPALLSVLTLSIAFVVSSTAFLNQNPPKATPVAAVDSASNITAESL